MIIILRFTKHSIQFILRPEETFTGYILRCVLTPYGHVFNLFGSGESSIATSLLIFDKERDKLFKYFIINNIF
jgi:hypothetical protein